MRLLDLFEATRLNEDELPTTHYGYWVGPNGEVIPVSHQAHEETIYDYALENPDSGLDPKRLINSYYSAFAKGWIRVVYGTSNESRVGSALEMAFPVNHLRRIAAQRLIQMIKSYDFNQFRFDVWENNSDRLQFQTFPTQAEAIQFIRGFMPAVSPIARAAE